MIIWGGVDGPLLRSDRFVDVGKVAEEVKPTTEISPKVTETSGLVGVAG